MVGRYNECIKLRHDGCEDNQQQDAHFPTTDEREIGARAAARVFNSTEIIVMAVAASNKMLLSSSIEAVAASRRPSGCARVVHAPKMLLRLAVLAILPTAATGMAATDICPRLPPPIQSANSNTITLALG